MNDSLFLAYSQSSLINPNHTVPELASIKIRDTFSKKVHKTYNIFKKNFENKETDAESMCSSIHTRVLDQMESMLYRLCGI